MRKRFILLVAVPCLCFGSCSQTTSTDPGGQGSEPREAVDSLQPWLRAQYGELCEIRATLVPADPNAKIPQEGVIRILEVEGSKFTNKVPLSTSPWDSSALAQFESLKPGDTFRATGYETIGTRGSPHGLATYDGGRFRDRMVADTNFSVQHTFVLLSIP